MKKLWLILLTFVFIASCTSSPDTESLEEDEVSQEAQNLSGDDQALDGELDQDAGVELAEEEIQDDINAADSSEIAFEDEAPSQNVAEEAFADESGYEEQQITQQEIAPIEEVPSAMDEPAYGDESFSNSDAGPVQVTGIDYKANENGGTVVVTTNGVATYTTEESPQNNQYIIEIQNATLPKQFTRPYNTKEFSGPIGMVNAFKSPNSNNVRVVVQLKKPTNLSIIQEGNSLVVVPGGSIAQAAPEPVAYDEAPSEPAVTMSASDEQEALKSKTLDEFLLGDTKFYGKRISVEIADGEIREVINFISEESGVNLVLSEDVKGKISVKLRQIPWDQALVVIMQTKQLGYIRQGNILRIAPLASIRQETDAARQLIEAQKQIEPLHTKVFPISYAKSKELEGQVTSFLSSRGTAKSDERMNAIVVKDIAENITKVERLLEKLDAQTPQVLIEGKVVETRESFARDLGVQWSGAGSANFTQDLVANTLSTKMATAGLAASLALSETDGKVKILSSPRVVVLNNQTAIIEQSNQFPIKSTVIGAGGAQTDTIEYKTVKLSLNVTPQIATDGGVILKTDILREFAGAEDTTLSGTNARPINSRSAKTTILVENGQTAVLGGIFQSDNTEGKTGLPILKDIPLIGHLFGQETLRKEKNELLIFLTPRILNRDKAFQLSEAPASSETL